MLLAANREGRDIVKGFSASVRKGEIVGIAGVSGSGKSSLVLDTIAASSRRELNETFPSFVQQYLPDRKSVV